MKKRIKTMLKRTTLFFIVFLVAGCASQSVQIWTNPYTVKNSVDEIIELRGQPFDVVQDTEETTLHFYAGFSKGNGWVWVPYVNMVAAGMTTWITSEIVVVDANGYYKSAQGQVKKNFDQMFVGLGKELSSMSKDFEPERQRVRDWYAARGLEFNEQFWEGQRAFRRTWEGM